MSTELDEKQHQDYDLDIIRIERIASAPAKVKRGKVSAADRLIAIAQRCIPHVNPKMFAGELAKMKPMADCYLNTLLRRAVNAAKRERAIARRALHQERRAADADGEGRAGSRGQRRVGGG